MGILRVNSITSLCSHDGEEKCEMCLAASCEPNGAASTECYSIKAPTHSFEGLTGKEDRLVNEVWQTQMALWTFSLSALFAYAWSKQHSIQRLCFTACVVAPAALCLTTALSMMLCVAVVVGRVMFSASDRASISYSDWLVAKRPPTPFSSRRSSGGRSTPPYNHHHHHHHQVNDQNANYVWLTKPTKTTVRRQISCSSSPSFTPAESPERKCTV